MKKCITFFLILLVVICVAACKEDVPLPPERQFYVNYLNAAMLDRAQANKDYCHYEGFYEELAYADNNHVLDYEIHEWKQLADQFWVVEATITSIYFPEGLHVYNFVGYVDGEMRIMQGLNAIPSELDLDVDLSAYEN